jgi:glyoxylase-like metal-dependent hydrolase (beta-lactamase superfamily II)
MEIVSRYISSSGCTIYTFPVRAFPELVANIYFISDGQQRILVDCGSGMDRSNRDLLAGLEAIEEIYGEPANLENLSAILITHGHIDHFGGLPFVRQFSQAPIGVHLLDRRILSHYEHRVIVASRLLENFLKRAGVPVGECKNIMAMYLFAKGIYHSTPVQISLGENGFQADSSCQDRISNKPQFQSSTIVGLNDRIFAYHVPGHCPGQVCLRIDDILLTADHVLSRTSPHQAPESITNNMGLGHYLDSLDNIQALNGIRLALGGHEDAMNDLAGRIGEIKPVHDERLEQVLEICSQPKTTAEISRELFGPVHNYHILLALEEAGAHVEYLYQRGELVATNLAEIESKPDPVIQYRRC